MMANSSTKSRFLQKYNDSYGYHDQGIDELRIKEFSRLKDQVYLDHAGSTLYAESQIKNISNDLLMNVFGNPHSQNPSSSRTSQAIDKMRNRILEFFNTDSKHYSVIFTSGCTASLKLIGETFPWSAQSKYWYSTENHNSVIGIREQAADNGASFSALDMEDICNIEKLEHIVQSNTHETEISQHKTTTYHLIALPAESNFSGLKLPLEVINHILELNNNTYAKEHKQQYMVLLDAAAYLSHGKLDLTKYPADYVALSFYKIFGYPTGIGALIVKNESAKILQKKYFGGGTVTASLSQERFHEFRKDIPAKFEDGTVSFLNIMALKYGFDIIQSLGMENISKHTHCLIQYLYEELSALSHANSKPVCKIYGRHKDDNINTQGPILTFNVLRKDGTFVGYHEFDQLASLNNIHVRVGCFCNPGGCHTNLNLSSEEVMENLRSGHVCWDDKDIIKGKPTGAIRVSLGYMSTFEDVERFIEFVKKYFVDHTEAVPQSVSLTEPVESLFLSHIYIYPIKSCGRFEVQDWSISSHGLLYDREWVLVDSSGNYLNQKHVPKLCLIRPMLDDTHMNLSAPSMQVLKISLHEMPPQQVHLSVCGDSCTGFVYDSTVNEWFSTFLDQQVTLVRTPPNPSRVSGARLLRSEQRRSDQEVLSENSNTTQCSIAYSNESQFLVVCESSVQEVASRMESKNLEAVAFRPNLVIGGGRPFQEDTWNEIWVDEQRFEIGMGCNRCKMICIDQDTAQEGKEPLLTLAKFRRTKGKILFGVHANHNPTSSTQPFRIRRSSAVFVSSSASNEE